MARKFAQLCYLIVYCIILVACDVFPGNSSVEYEFIRPNAQIEGRVSLVEVTKQNVKELNSATKPGVRVAPLPISNDLPFELRIQPGDLLTVTIWDSSDNSLILSPGQKSIALEELKVDNEGAVSLPYLGAVKIGNLSKLEAQKVISGRLQEISGSSYVQISKWDSIANYVSVQSGLVKPGNYPLRKDPYRLSDLLSDCGGVADDKLDWIVYLTRKGVLHSEFYSKIRDDPKLNFRLYPGDQVSLVEDGRQFIALGAVSNQNVFSFKGKNPTAASAVASIDGVDPNVANPSGVLILRTLYSPNKGQGPTAQSSEEYLVLKVDLASAAGVFVANQLLIKDGDILYVTEAPVTSLDQIVTLFGKLIRF